MAKPIIVITPGSFSPATEYDALTMHLQSAGYETHAYDLPTASRVPADLQGFEGQAPTLAEDAAFFKGVCAALCDQSQDVVILGHSYGGMVVSEAVRGLTKRRVGKGRVLGMIYLSAAAVKEGQTLMEVCTETGIELGFVKMDGELMYMDPIEESAKINFSDLPFEQALTLAKRFAYHSAPSFGNKLQYAGYKDVDNVAFINLTQDKTLPQNFQDICMANIRSAREGASADKSALKVYTLDSSHCPHASRPVDLSRVITTAISEFAVGK